MIIFIIYLLILTQTIYSASFEPISTENYIKPAINLNETEDNNQTTFVGFIGKPGNYKKAQLFIVNKKGELVCKSSFPSKPLFYNCLQKILEKNCNA